MLGRYRFYRNRLRCWLARRALRTITTIDYSITKGDLVVSRTWGSDRTLEVVDVNYAVLAIAVRMRAGDPRAGIVVWPIWAVQKV